MVKTKPLFPLKVVTPTGVIYEGFVEEVSAVSPEGEFGVLADHVDFIAALAPGWLSIKPPESATVEYRITDGLAHVYRGAMTITTTKVEAGDQYDLATVIVERTLRLRQLEAEMVAAENLLEQARRRQSVEPGN
jgi:F-type H+-transporting ATPase subunit epsilon